MDWAAAWLDLKAHIITKRSHGEDELAREMARLEVQHRVPEGQRGFSDGPVPLRPEDRGDGEPAHEQPRMAARDG